MEIILLEALVYLFAAVAAVPIAKRLGLGSVLGYLIAGIIIAPLLSFIGSDTESLEALCRIRRCHDAVSRRAGA